MGPKCSLGESLFDKNISYQIVEKVEANLFQKGFAKMCLKNILSRTEMYFFFRYVFFALP